MTGGHGDDQLEARECFLYFYKNLQRHYYTKAHKHLSPPEVEALAETAYLDFYQEKQTAVGHYFRNLYNIVRFVKDSRVEDKHFYIRLVRSQLSVFELSLLFYNCLSSPGRGFKPLVEEFALLKTIDDKDLLNPSHRKYYTPAAFGEPVS